jgi:transposase
MGYISERVSYKEGACIFRIVPQERLLRCPICGTRNVQRRGSVHRVIRLLPTGTHKNYAELDIPRVYCPRCESLRQIRLGFAEESRTCSKTFERYVRELCDLMTTSDVARHLGIPWSTVKDIHKRHLEKKYGKLNLKNLRTLAIDEISNGKGHKYLTIVLNLESGAVVFVGEGKGTDALVPFWEKLGRRREKIRAVAADMSPAYTKAVRENLPNATLVYDHFHVIKLYNEKLSGLRRELYRETKDADMKGLLKGTRWLLLKNRGNLDKGRNEPERLEAALTANRPLMTAYYLKEELHRIWEQEDQAAANRVFDAWVETAEVSGVPILKKFAQMLSEHREGILNCYSRRPKNARDNERDLSPEASSLDRVGEETENVILRTFSGADKSRITTAALEGTNTKIRVLQRRAYGYRDKEYLKLRILALHETSFKVAI